MGRQVCRKIKGRTEKKIGVEKIGVEPRFLETAVRPLFKLRFDPIFAYLRPPIFVTSVTVICAAKTDNRRQIRTQTGQADADGQENRRKGRDS